MSSLYSDSSRSRTDDSSSITTDGDFANDDDSNATMMTTAATTTTTMHQHVTTTTTTTTTNNNVSVLMGQNHYGTIDEMNDEVDNEEEEEITPAELIAQLKQAWLNEKFSPELLYYQNDVVKCIIDQITVMDKNIRSARRGDFRIAIHKLELDRIKYMLCSYLKARIKKIEQFASVILEEDRMRHGQAVSKLSAEEYAYANEYLKNVRDHLSASVLEHLPVNLQDLNEAVTMPKPDLNKFVFFKSLESISGILLDDLATDGRSEIVDTNKDDLFVMRYKPIGNYVQASKIQLI